MQVLDKLPKNSYIEYLSKRYLNLNKITNGEIVEHLILLEYFGLTAKTNDLTTFNNIIEIVYGNTKKECEMVKKEVKKTRPINVLNLYLMTLPNHLGWIWQDYALNEINYFASQVFNEFVIQINKDGDLDVDSPIFSQIFDRQQRQHLNIKDDKYSGAVETHTDFLVSQTQVEVGKDYEMEKVRFIGVGDSKQTKMCKSLDGKVFYLNKWNEYDRYSAIDDKIVRYKTFGLKLGENQPPITNSWHYCRSTMTYQIEED